MSLINSILAEITKTRQSSISCKFGTHICQEDFDCASCPIKGVAVSLSPTSPYCPSCGYDRVILKDMLHSRGFRRKTNEIRKQSAQEVIGRCPDCQEYFGMVKA